MGGCGSASREHIVTESLWLGTKINVTGFPWCKDSAVEIGLSSFTAKILCREHNSLLSSTDAEAKKAFEAFRESTRLSNEREENVHHAWPPVSFVIDGLLLERWFLKTLINIVSLQERTDLVWFGTNQPPEHIVRIAYGRKKFLWPKGLYAAATLNQAEHSDESMNFSPLLHEETASIAGGLFTFRGARFLLYLGRRPLPEPFDLPNTNLPNWKSSILRYRLKHIEWTLEAGRQSHSINFLWR
jgi:hypothetical protein